MLASDAIIKAYREASIRPIGWGEPTDAENEEGLYRLNALWKGIRATALGEVTRDWQVPNKTRTAPHNADNQLQFFPQNLNGFNQPGYGWNDDDVTGGEGVDNHRQHYPPINARILCALVDNGNTIWFPQYPYDGSRMEITSLPAMTQSVDLSGNGRSIEGSDIYTFNPGDPKRQWLYRADIATWVSIGDDLTLDSELPLPDEFDDFFVCGVAIRLCALDRLDPQPETASAFKLTEQKIYQRFYQPGVMTYGGQNAVPSYQTYNNFLGWGTNFRSGS